MATIMVEATQWENIARRLVQNFQRRFPGTWEVDQDWGENLRIAGGREVIHCLGRGQATTLIAISEGAQLQELTAEQWYDAARILTGELLKVLPGPWEVHPGIRTAVRRVQGAHDILMDFSEPGHAARLVELSQKISDELLIGKIWLACMEVGQKEPNTLYFEAEERLKGDISSPYEAYVAAAALLRKYEYDPFSIFKKYGINRPLDHPE